METTDLLRQVKRIEIKTRKLTNNIFAGEYHSAFKGHGMSFAEVREYQPGDDIRDIDWNVTARMNRTYVKVFEEERELTLILLVDLSASQRFGTSHFTQRELSAEIAATLAFSAMQNNDKVGAIFFTDKIESFIPPQKGKKHILYIIRELLGFQPTGKKTDVRIALEYLMRVLTKRSIAFLISDFLDMNDFSRPLMVAANKHDIIGLCVHDRLMEELPNVGLIKVADLESGHEQYIDTSSSKVRTHHKRWWALHESKMAQLFKMNGIDFVTLTTHNDYVRPLMNLLTRR